MSRTQGLDELLIPLATSHRLRAAGVAASPIPVERLGHWAAERLRRLGVRTWSALASLTVGTYTAGWPVGEASVDEVRQLAQAVSAAAAADQVGGAPAKEPMFDAATCARLVSPAFASIKLTSELIGARAWSRLGRGGITKVGDLVRLTVEDFLALPHVGSVSLAELRSGVVRLLETRDPAADAEPPGSAGSMPDGPIPVGHGLSDAWLPKALTCPPLASRTANALRRGGINTVGDLAPHTTADLMALQGMGAHGLADIVKHLDRLRATSPPAPIDPSTNVARWLGLSGPVMAGLATWSNRIWCDDPLLGGVGDGSVQLGDLLRGNIGAHPDLLVHRARLAQGIEVLARRIVNPESLLEDLGRLLPNNREGRMAADRWGWLDGEAKTLEAVGVSLNLTRERVRQVIKKVESDLPGRVFLPSVAALVDVLEASGGVAEVAGMMPTLLRRGLLRDAKELGALRELLPPRDVDDPCATVRRGGWVDRARPCSPAGCGPHDSAAAAED